MQNLAVQVAETDNCLVLSWEARQAQQPQDQCPFYQLYRRQGDAPWAPMLRMEAVGYTQQATYAFQDCNFCQTADAVAYRIEYVADISGICDESVLDTLFSADISLADPPCLRAASTCAKALVAGLHSDGVQLTYCIGPMAGAAWLEAVDLAGRKVWQWEVPLLGGGIGTSGTTMWVPDLSASCYLVMLRDDLGNQHVVKVLR